MDAPRRLEPADLEFEPVPARSRARDLDPRNYQRVVVNPFLAVLGLVVLAKSIPWLLDSPFPPAVVLVIAPFCLLPQLVQFHCLDCGQDGRYRRLDRHACPAVEARFDKDRPPRFPTGRAQLIVWGWILGSIGLLILVQGWDHF